MSDDDRVRRLEELVRDERARRVYAEQELASERGRVEVWRQRAEERADALRRAREKPRKAGRWRRKRATEPPAGRPPEPRPADSNREPDQDPTAYQPICQPTLRVGVWGAPAWLEVAADVFSVDDNPEALAWADLVVVGSPGARPSLDEWAGWDSRPPLVLWEPNRALIEEWEPVLTDRDLVIGGDVGAGSAVSLPTLPVAPNPDFRPPPQESWLDVSDESTLEQIVTEATFRPLRWSGSAPPGPDLAGLVATVPAADPEKQSIRARLVLRSRFGPGAALDRMAAATGLDLPSWRPEVGLLVVTRRPERVPGLLERVAAFQYPHVRLVIGLHGEGDVGEVQGIADELGVGKRMTARRFQEDWPLGRCLNEAAGSVGSAVLAKIDDDDLYGPWYLDEAVAALQDTGADLVGKMTQYVHLVSSDRLVLFQPGKEYSEVGYVNGPTFVMPRVTWERVRFPHRRARVDSTFVRGLRAVGGTIRSTSRFEFVLGRYPSGHTWETSEDHFLARGDVVGSGSDVPVAWLDG